jgi:hypothetical protein
VFRFGTDRPQRGAFEQTRSFLLGQRVKSSYENCEFVIRPLDTFNRHKLIVLIPKNPSRWLRRAVEGWAAELYKMTIALSFSRMLREPGRANMMTANGTALVRASLSSGSSNVGQPRRRRREF